MLYIPGALINIPAVNSEVRKNTKQMEEKFACLLVTASTELRKLGVTGAVQLRFFILSGVRRSVYS